MLFGSAHGSESLTATMDQNAGIFSAILIASIVVIIIILYFAISLVRHQRKVFALNRQNVLREIATLEKDRSRMAADLHDELGPMLSQVKFRVNSIDTTDPDDLEQQEKSSSQIDEVIQRIRGIAKDLMPGSLLKKGLHTAIKEFIDGINLNGQVKVKFINESKLEVNEERSINIYRAIQEVCQNVIKHANATIFLIKFYDEKNTLHIICEDNGKGFNYEKLLEESQGIGLRNLRSRIEVMGGKVKVTSMTGKGTQYHFEIPMH
jgi:two-component system, NarL family, sensor kinase